MPSILETFLVLFESDSAEVEKGAAKAKQTTDKLNASLNSTNQISGKVGSSFSRLVKQAAGAAAAFLSVSAILGGIRSAANYSAQLDGLSKTLNVNVQDLDSWGNAVKKNGGTQEGFYETVKSLTTSLTDFAVKGKSNAAPFFQELGIKMTDAKGKARDFLEILPELADRFEKLDKSESFGLGQKLGLDSGTILLLQQGRREVDAIIKRQKELGVVTKQDAEIAAKFNDQWDDTAHAFRSLFTLVGSSVLPAFTAIANFFEKTALFFKKHSNLIVGGLIAIGTALAVYIAPAAAAAIAAFAPFILIGTVISGLVAGFALLYDDIVHFNKGTNSLIGEAVKKWPVLGEIFKGIKEAIVQSIKSIKEAFIDAGEIIKNVWDSVTFVIKSSIDYILSLIDKISSGFNSVKSVLGFGKTADSSQVLENIKRANDAVISASASPLSSQTSSSILNSSPTSNKNVTVQTGDITIQTQATDGEEIAKSFAGSLQQQMKQANANFDDGVMA